MTAVAFDHPELFDVLENMSDDALNELEFGVIGFNPVCDVQRYNRFEAQAAGLSTSSVIGNHLFTTVAPCMNNFMVAQRFDDAFGSKMALDAVIDYVLTLRMRPTRVQLRLLASTKPDMRYIAVRRFN